MTGGREDAHRQLRLTQRETMEQTRQITEDRRALQTDLSNSETAVCNRKQAI